MEAAEHAGERKGKAERAYGLQAEPAIEAEGSHGGTGGAEGNGATEDRAPTIAYPRTRLQIELSVRRLISFHYFEFAPDFKFEGEKHDFWEFVYVDKGELEVFADTEGYLLRQGDVIFHKPGEFHGVWANGVRSPNVIIVSFECPSPAIAHFNNRILSLNDRQKELLAQLIRSGFAAFLPPYDDPLDHTLLRKPDAPFGAEQSIKLYLELLLIDLYQAGCEPAREQRLSSAVTIRSEADLASRMAAYLEAHVEGQVRLELICRHFHMSKTHALALFKKCMGLSIMRYYRQLKIERAKAIIREQMHTFTEIAAMLHYPTVHNFSRHFRHETGMSPSEYARTVQARR